MVIETVRPHVIVTWITEESEFLARRDLWNDVASSARGHAVFLRHEWFDAAWEWRKNEQCSLRIAFVSRDDEVIGICPLLLHRTRGHGLPVRKLEFLSVPDTQFCDIVCAEPDGPDVCGAIAAALGERAWEWDVLDLRHLPQNAVARALASDACSEPRFEESAWDNNLLIDLEESWEDFYGRRGRSLKKGNNLAANRLRRAGHLELHWTRGAGEPRDRVDALLEEFVALSSKSWKAETGLTLENPGPGAFIRRLTRHALEQGWLSMWDLRLNGKLVAMEYQLLSNGEVFALRADFDQSLETSSPGSYLSWQLLQALFGGGLKRYWLGPGVNPYKARWTDRGEPLFRIAAYSPTARGRMLDWNERLVRAAKNVLARLRTPASRERTGAET